MLSQPQSLNIDWDCGPPPHAHVLDSAMTAPLSDDCLVFEGFRHASSRIRTPPAWDNKSATQRTLLVPSAPSSHDSSRLLVLLIDTLRSIKVGTCISTTTVLHGCRKKLRMRWRA